MDALAAPQDDDDDEEERAARHTRRQELAKHRHLQRQDSALVRAGSVSLQRHVMHDETSMHSLQHTVLNITKTNICKTAEVTATSNVTASMSMGAVNFGSFNQEIVTTVSTRVQHEMDVAAMTAACHAGVSMMSLSSSLFPHVPAFTQTYGIVIPQSWCLVVGQVTITCGE